MLLVASASAAELAVLRNGFSIRHNSRESLGEITRLHTGSGYVDVPSQEIVAIEADETPAVPAPSVQAPGFNPVSELSFETRDFSPGTFTARSHAADLTNIIGTAGDRHQIDPDLISSIVRAESGFNARAVSPKGAQGLMQLMPQTALQLGITDAFNPDANIDAGTRYLRGLLARYRGDLPKALAAYNAGPHRVEQYRGVPPYRETHAYVARVIREFNRKKLTGRKRN